MLSNFGVFVIEGIDVYNFYDEDYYGMSAYIFRYQENGKDFLFTTPAIYFECILKILSVTIKDKYCILLEKFIFGGLDFDFYFKNKELGFWWEISDKHLFLKNLNSISLIHISDYFNNFDDCDVSMVKKILESLLFYLKDSKDKKIYLHYM